ncbi:hypothetical protein Bca101_010944 [Brassica carinata]
MRKWKKQNLKKSMKLDLEIWKFKMLPQRQKMKSGSNTSGCSSKGGKQKCALLDCNNSGQRVALGRVFSTDPAEKVHFVPLGPNASKVWVEVSEFDGARVWRPNSEIEFIDDAVGSTVAWPNDKLVLM